MEAITNRIKGEAENLNQHHIDEGHICEKSLIQIETSIALLRQYKNEEKAPID